MKQRWRAPDARASADVATAMCVQGKAKFTEMQAAFAATIQKRLQCRRTGAPFHAADELSAVLGKADGSGAERAHGRVADVWRVVQLQHARWQAAGGPRLPAAEAQVALLKGSMEHLEGEYYAHMETRVRGARQEARSGGSGSAASVIAGYVNTCGRAGDGARDHQAHAWQQVRIILLWELAAAVEHQRRCVDAGHQAIDR